MLCCVVAKQLFALVELLLSSGCYGGGGGGGGEGEGEDK